MDRAPACEKRAVSHFNRRSIAVQSPGQLHGKESGLTADLENLEQEIGAPTCPFSAGLDASGGFVVAEEVESEAADDGYVLGAMACPVSRQIIAEFDVEQPVHALHPPMAATSFGSAFDVERRGADVGAGVEGRAIGMFGPGVDLDDGLDVGEARLPGIAALGHDPVDRLRGGVGAGLDAAV